MYLQLLFVKITYVPLIVTKQLACFCSFAAALIAAKRSEFLEIELYTDVLFYFGDGFQVILKIVVVRFRS